MTKSDEHKNLPSVRKPCPKCGGSGKVTSDGKERFRQIYKGWAEGFHLKPVVFSWQGKVAIPGLAVAQLLPGGWYGLKVYVAVTAIPESGVIEAGPDGYMAYRLDGRGVPHPVIGIQEVDLNYFDIINGKAFWYLFCHSTRRHELKPLGHYPEALGPAERRLIEERTA